MYGAARVKLPSWRNNYAIARAHGVGRRKIHFFHAFSFFSFFPFFSFSLLDGNPDGNLDGNLLNGVFRDIQFINSVPSCCDR